MNPEKLIEHIEAGLPEISPEIIAELLKDGAPAASESGIGATDAHEASARAYAASESGISAFDVREALFTRARRVRSETFGDKIFLYGFVYFSTWCRNNCNFCYFRADNDIRRYRKSPGEIIETAERLVASGVNLIDLTMGEDSEYHRENFKSLVSIIQEIKSRTGAPVMVSPGVIPQDAVRRLADAGADLFALYQETHNRELFEKLRVGQDYDERMDCKLAAKAAGMHIEEGILTGVGETPKDLYDSLMEMGRIGADQMRAMSFVPQQGSPMENNAKGDRTTELVFIALLRILYPHALIPASLDVDGMAGLAPRIGAGANVVTSIIPPRSGYQGVAQSDLDIDEGARTVTEATAMLKELGLRSATREEYRAYLKGIPGQE
ncbi:MAG: methylornithine synthase PylB [Clostridiales Family XIII bacterium]|jgi:methylornithine synthase|nr:methylornithine synthase PylB [Clostridiales Family XIII bacterium]